MIDTDLVSKLVMGRIDIVAAPRLTPDEYIRAIIKSQRRLRWKQNVRLAKLRRALEELKP